MFYITHGWGVLTAQVDTYSHSGGEENGIARFSVNFQIVNSPPAPVNTSRIDFLNFFDDSLEAVNNLLVNANNILDLIPTYYEMIIASRRRMIENIVFNTFITLRRVDDQLVKITNYFSDKDRIDNNFLDFLYDFLTLDDDVPIKEKLSFYDQFLFPEYSTVNTNLIEEGIRPLPEEIAYVQEDNVGREAVKFVAYRFYIELILSEEFTRIENKQYIDRIVRSIDISIIDLTIENSFSFLENMKNNILNYYNNYLLSNTKRIQTEEKPLLVIAYENGITDIDRVIDNNNLQDINTLPSEILI